MAYIWENLLLLDIVFKIIKLLEQEERLDYKRKELYRLATEVASGSLVL